MKNKKNKGIRDQYQSVGIKYQKILKCKD